MIRIQYDCDVCGVTVPREGDGEDSGLANGWLEVVGRRRVINPAWEEQVDAQETLVETQLAMAQAGAAAQGATIEAGDLEKMREAVEAQTILQAPVTASEWIDEEARNHYCAKHATKIIPLVGGAVQEMFAATIEDAHEESGAVGAP